jgi:hypothetical protein
MESFDDILKGAREHVQGQTGSVQAAPDTAPVQEAPKGETQSSAAPAGQAQAAPAQADDDEGETPTPDVYGKVPLTALQNERAKRQDWKTKAIQAEERQRAAEERIAAMEKERQAAQAPAAQTQPPASARAPALPNPVEDPEGYQRALDARFEKHRLDTSEAITRRQHGDEAVNAAFETFKAHATPAEYKAVMADRDPWSAMVEKAKGMALRAEIGTDPAAYEARLREKLRAEVEAERRDGAPTINQNAKEANPHRPPPSLAAARSAASSKAPAAAWTGPVPLAGLIGVNAASVRR